MKTKKEVKKFLASFRFLDLDAERIVGFLLGKGVVEKGEFIKFSTRKGFLELVTFDEFYSWFESEDTRLEDLLNFLQDEQDKALDKGDNKRANDMAIFLGFLVEELNLGYQEDDKA